tara:strand:- start:37756 stop:39303 length:1548 start_codon:yes stop_codon:yes gene_type:complete
MSSASSARQLGDEAHQYLFWQFSGRMLAKCQITAVGFETGEFTAFDDVAVKFAKPRPDGLGGYFNEDHIQSKFSVAGGKVLTGEGLTDPRLINATKISLLERLRDAVNKAENEGRRCSFTLSSPWPIEQGSLLDQMRDAAQGALRLNLLFEGKTVKSESGKLRKFWADCLKLDMNDEAELSRILRPLRIHVESRTLDQIRSHVSDLLPSAGLLPIDDCSRTDSYPLLIQRLHREGQRWFGADQLIEACRHEGLWVGKPEIPRPITRLGIRTFKRFAEDLEDQTDEMICLTEFFSDRHIRHADDWEGKVLPGLRSFLGSKLAKGGRYRLLLPAVGSVAFTSGYLAEPKLGASFEVEQSGVGGTSIWQCGTAEGTESAGWSTHISDLGRAGGEFAVAISVTHPIAEAVQKFVESQLPAVGKLLNIELARTGHDSVRDGSHAFSIVKEAVDLIRSHGTAARATGRVHLFWAAPNAMAFMLGQLARPLGTITLYEFDFEGIVNGSYCPSLVLDPSIRLN